VFAVIVTGPPGAGKTVCLTALADALADAKVAHAAIDADEVSWAFPYPDTPRRTELVAAAWNAHRGDGHELFLIAEVIESSEHLAELLAAIGAADHLLVRLEAAPRRCASASSRASRPAGPASSTCWGRWSAGRSRSPRWTACT
jgi:hypothetical protein